MTTDFDALLTNDPAPRVLRGKHTYRLLRKLGEGGQGAVYEAEDLDRGKRIAIKLLRNLSESTVSRFKREFRIRERITHPCLVEFGELGLDEGQWFFTMSLVSGVPLLGYVAGSEPRLRAAFAQLAEGIAALHAVGVVHRDIKPENILVESDGRLVLLDLGLAVDMGPKDATQAVGTPAYMAPEQWTAQPISAAVDWYAFGVILFEALSGERPFIGSHMDIFIAKTQQPAPSLPTSAAQQPEDLRELCEGLLAQKVRERLGAHDVLRCFSDYSPERVVQAELHSAVVGRADELAGLERTLERVARDRRARLIVVEGDSGIGKTALVRALAERARGSGHWVLAGSCYEAESVPFKAFDQLLDELARQLRVQRKGALERYRPRNAALLARVFPALSVLRPERLAFAPQPVDPVELRSRAVAALNELLERMSEDEPLLLCLDDVQWADGDSLELIDQLSRCEFPLALLASYRADSPHAATLRGLASTTLRLTALDLAATRKLAESVSDRVRDCPPAFFERMHRDTGGSPFLICEWARFVHLHGAEPAHELEQLLKARINELAPARRRLLNVVAVTGEPLDARLAALVAESDEVADTMSLRRDRMLRTLVRDGASQLDVYHDRIRQVVCEELAPEQRRQIHSRVSEGLARLGAPPERRVAAQLAAGDLHGAARSAMEAAKVADSTLAFQRAAEYYGLALELWTGGDDERVELLVQRATAFENALRPSLAGECLQDASRLCRSPERGRELLRLAGEQYLLSGELDKGLGALQQALADHQLTLPASAPFALGEAMTLMAQLTQRGLVPATRTELSLHLTERIELCLSVARCLHHVDVRGLPFAIRGLLEALDQPSAELRQQAFAVFVMTTAGHLPTPLVAPALEACRALTKAQPTPIAQARMRMAEAEFEYFQGKYSAAERACERAERILINACVGVSRELGQIRSTLLVMAHSDRGDFRSNAERALSWLEDADRRRDKFYGNWLRASYALVWMAQDQPERARREIARAEAEWPASTGGTFETACALYLDACDRYEDLPGTHQRAAQARATVLQSPVVHSPMLQGYLHLHRAWGALRELGSRPKQHDPASRRTLRRQIQESVANLRKLSVMVWSATADAYEANLFVLDGELDRADDLLERAFSGFVATHHHALAACIRRRWGEVVGGDVGLRWQSESDLELGRLGVVAPARFARAYFSPFSAHSFDRCSEPTLSD